MTNLESLLRAAFIEGFKFADDRGCDEEDRERAWQMHRDTLMKGTAEPGAKPEFTGFVCCTFDGGEPVCYHEGYSGLSKDCPEHGSGMNREGKS